MSGIHGLLRFDSGRAAPRDLERQARAMAHRGKDRRGQWQDGPVGLGSLLNQITAEDAFDRQPLHDASTVALVADLRLDNRDELAAALGIAAEALAATADSTLLLQAYLRWGEDCAGRLLGDFAFAIWDGRARKLVLGRDHIGQRHLFYHRGETMFVFASEPRGLWAVPDVPRKLATDTIGARMILVHEPRNGATQFEQVFGLEGGTVMTVSADGTLATRRYWTPQAGAEHVGRDEAYYVEAYRRVLGEAVACRLRRATRPAALYLGGGFDSGAIAALAGPAVTAQRRKLIAIASVMPEGDDTTPRNARKWVDFIARDMKHLEVRRITREGLDIFTGLEASFVQVEGLRGPDRYVNDALAREAVAAGARIAMDGEGGDYTLNPRARRALLRILLRGRVLEFLREMRAYRAASGAGPARLFLREVVAPLLPASLWAPFARLRLGLAPFTVPMPVAKTFLRTLAAAGIRPSPALAGARLQDRRIGLAKVLSRLQSAPVLGGSLQAAYHGLELTQPFHDKRVVELALAIPESLIFKNGRDRYLARRALADLLPRELLRRGDMNDDRAPDFCDMVRRIEPAILADIARMEAEGRMTRYFDFPRMRRMLTGRQRPWRGQRATAAVQHAARSYLHARYTEWFQRDNYGGDDNS